MNKQVPETQSILAGRGFASVFHREETKCHLCFLWPFEARWGLGSRVPLDVPGPVCAHALGFQWDFNL